MDRFFVRVGVGIVLVLVLLAVAAGGFIWWKIAGLKETLVKDLGHKLGAQVQVASIDLDIWHGELHAAGILLTNERPASPWEKGEISQATMHFAFRDVFAPSLPVSVEVSSWNLVLRSPLRAAETPPSSDAPEMQAAPAEGRVHVTQLSALEGTVEVDLSDDRKIQIHGIDFTATDNGGGVWTTQLHAASLKAGTFEAGTSAVQILGDKEHLTFSELHMQCAQGAITGEGEAALSGNHEAQFHLKGVDVPVTMLVPIEWQMKVTGLITGDLTYEGADQDSSAKGQLSVNHGIFNVLPWLSKVTTMVGLPDLSNVEVDHATTDFSWKDGTLSLTNLDIRKNDVVRVGGGFDISPTSQVDAKLKLGLPSTITSKWPMIQDKVFTEQNDNYNWADVHVTGSPDHLEEDLTPRLVNGATQEGTDMWNQALQKASDLYKTTLGK